MTDDQKKLLTKLKNDKNKIIEILKKRGKEYQSLPKKKKNNSK